MAKQIRKYDERGPARHDKKAGEPLEKIIKNRERKHRSDEPWGCPQCGYKVNVDKQSKNCQNCGADFMGRPGKPPAEYDREARAGLRSDVSQGFTEGEY